MMINYNVREQMGQGQFPAFAFAPEPAPVVAPPQIVYSPVQTQRIAADALSGNVALGQGFADFLGAQPVAAAPAPAPVGLGGFGGSLAAPTNPPQLTPEQQVAFDALQKALASLPAQPVAAAPAPPPAADPQPLTPQQQIAFDFLSSIVSRWPQPQPANPAWTAADLL